MGSIQTVRIRWWGIEWLAGWVLAIIKSHSQIAPLRLLILIVILTSKLFIITSMFANILILFWSDQVWKEVQLVLQQTVELSKMRSVSTVRLDAQRCFFYVPFSQQTEKVQHHLNISGHYIGAAKTKEMCTIFATGCKSIFVVFLNLSRAWNCALPKNPFRDFFFARICAVGHQVASAAVQQHSCCHCNAALFAPLYSTAFHWLSWKLHFCNLPKIPWTCGNCPLKLFCTRHCSVIIGQLWFFFWFLRQFFSL